VPATVTHQAGEQLQLIDGAHALALQARFWQTAFLMDSIDEGIAQPKKALGDGVQKLRATLIGHLAVRVKSRLRQFASGVHIGLAAGAKRRFELFTGCRCQGKYFTRIAPDRALTNDRFTKNLHR
jgi:hypothetical protein